MEIYRIYSSFSFWPKLMAVIAYTQETIYENWNLIGLYKIILFILKLVMDGVRNWRLSKFSQVPLSAKPNQIFNFNSNIYLLE